MTSRSLRLLVLGGPTGVGKTATAVALARRRSIEVISADSRQVYRGMDVATGKPTAEERAAVVHHLVDVVDPDERYHAARFRAEAAALVEAIHARGRLPVVVGGTGLYIRALVCGLDPAPPADPDFRGALAALAAREGRPALHARLSATAPEMARRLHPNDHVRVTRALELLRSGHPVGLARVRWQQRDPAYDVTYIGLTLPRAVLAERLRERAEAMVAAGLADEIRALLARGYRAMLPALQGIGYRQFVDVVRGGMSVEEATRLMVRDTARYAKRQLTWFTREPDIEWMDVDAAGGPARAAAAIEARLEQGGHIE
jgi:tRNA dimethylallyltransferase